MDPDPGHENFYKILTKEKFRIIFLFFSLIFILKLDEPFIVQGSFVIFFLQSRFGF